MIRHYVIHPTIWEVLCKSNHCLPGIGYLSSTEVQLEYWITIIMGYYPLMKTSTYLVTDLGIPKLELFKKTKTKTKTNKTKNKNENKQEF